MQNNSLKSVGKMPINEVHAWLAISLAVILAVWAIYAASQLVRIEESSSYALNYSSTILLRGTTSTKYKPTVANNTLFDAKGWLTTAVDGVSTNTAVSIEGKDSGGGGNGWTWLGGIIKGLLPETWDWQLAHDFGGAGLVFNNDGPVEAAYLRVHNVEDGFRTREKPGYSNTGSWFVHDCYMTAIRDDAVEDDNFEPGTVQNCLFDGINTFISEQNQDVGISTAIGTNEDQNIYVKNVLVRLHPSNTVEDNGGGRWVKWKGENAGNHRLIVSDSIFAASKLPRTGSWGKLSLPPELTWVGTNNYILWLGPVGTYGGPKPSGVKFLEGQAAVDKWISARNDWLVAHGLPSQNFPADYNSLNAPLDQIPFILGEQPTPTSTATPTPTTTPSPSPSPTPTPSPSPTPTGTATAIPAIPTGLKATSGVQSVILSWNANTESNLKNYGIHYKLSSSSSWILISNISKTATSYTVTGLASGKSYDFRIRARNTSDATSAWSSSVSATPQ